MTRVAIEYDPDFQAHTCAGCGTSFAVPYNLYRCFKEDGASLRCPNASCPWPSFSIHETKAMRLEKELAAERERATRAHQAREWAEKQLSATKGQVTKLRNEAAKAHARIANGVCPCCKRSFQNLRRHMTTKHPEYASGE